MRHRLAHRKLGRTTAHRWSLRRNLTQSLFEHGQITTTLAKAKDVRRFAEKLITLAKKARQGDLTARRRVVQLLVDRAIIPKDHQEEYESLPDAKRDKVLRARTGRRYRRGEPHGGMKFTAVSVVHHLIEEIAERFEDRSGGYTRLIRLGKTRLGDNGAQAVLQLVGQEESPGSVTRPEKSARRRRAEARREAAAKVLGDRSKPAKPATAVAEAADDSEAEEEATAAEQTAKADDDESAGDEESSSKES